MPSKFNDPSKIAGGFTLAAGILTGIAALAYQIFSNDPDIKVPFVSILATMALLECASGLVCLCCCQQEAPIDDSYQSMVVVTNS